MNELLEKIRSKYPFVKIDAYESKYKIEVISIKIPPSQQSMGIGSDIFEEIKEYAHLVNKPIVVRPAPERGKKQKLESFYKRLGFVYNAGRNMDPTLSSPFATTMIWNPSWKKTSFKDFMQEKNPPESGF